MKAVFLSVLVSLACLLPVRSYAQPEAAPSPESRDQTITANPVGILFGQFNLEYEHAAGQSVSWFVGPEFAYLSASSTTLTGYGGTGGLRFFFGDAAPKGGWLGPQLTFIYISANFGGAGSVSAAAYSLAGLAGYTWVFDGGFVLSLGAGLQYISMELKSSAGTSVGLKGVLPAARLSLGYGF